MIEFIFTIDYEIYGNGEGSLKELVLEPTRKLIKTFDQANAKLVFFVEAAELEKIEEAKSDPAIYDVKSQIKDLYEQGYEIALHLHPQWYNGEYKNGKWELDNAEYNLCVLQEKRIAQIVDQSINYLGSILGNTDYKPLSFRAGNWLFQPAQPTAKILYERGVRIDSSVFKGGVQHQTKLDYRKALKNGYFWNFQNDVNKPVKDGEMIEVPIYSEMVPPWKMATRKRLALQQKAATSRKSLMDTINRVLDMTRPLQPLKLDFCRMTMEELTEMMNRIIKMDLKTPDAYKPILAIGHTKDLSDFETVSRFISHLIQKQIKICTFQKCYLKYIIDNHKLFC